MMLILTGICISFGDFQQTHNLFWSRTISARWRWQIVLYGITMQEHGVSCMVGVHFEEVVELTRENVAPR